MNDLPIDAQIVLALGYNEWPLLRKIACSLACRQIKELHQYGRFPAGMKFLDKLSKRWKLGDVVCAMMAHFPF